MSDEAKKACDAGAAVVHVHVRDPKNGAPSADLCLEGNTKKN
ncbi:MAG: 3-keto-5-aminohexanoate cleavage protein [Candidatus Lokiarchaeia archaeon]